MKTTHTKCNFFQPKAVCFKGTKVLSRNILRKRGTERGEGWIRQAFLTWIMSNVQNLHSLRKNMGLGSHLVHYSEANLGHKVLHSPTTLIFICKYRP